jgi:outer membrane receptor protein involved in Fe transport
MASAAAVCMTPAVFAQSPGPAAPTDTPPADAAAQGDIVVTGSRIIENGYKSPTPVTVATTADLALSSPTSISDGLRKLPQLIGSATPNGQSNVFVSSAHGNVLNLRGLGPNRTLVLLDGVRVAPTTYTNTVDVDILPQLLVQRVDIATGGASASYGSDAVAGVVNYILDTKFTGVKGTAQGGITSRGDARNQRFGLALGSNLSDRVHLLLSAEYYHNSGYTEKDRPKLNDSGLYVGNVPGSTAAPGTTANPLVPMTNLRANFTAPGGLATTGPFANTIFDAAGLYHPLVKGTPTGTAIIFKAPSDYYTLTDVLSAAGRLRNINLFGRLSYDLDDDTTAYAQVMGARSTIRTQTLPNELALPAGTLFSGNAFLPPALQQQLTNTGTASFGFTKIFNEHGPIQTHERISNLDEQVGIKGKIDRFNWNLNFLHGSSVYKFYQDNQFNQPYLYAALDAVVNPASGQIVCAPSISANPVVAARYAGCVPFNPFGNNAASPAAYAYVTQGASQFRAVNTINDLSANVSGHLFDLPAGPVAMAVGGEYHTAALRITSNANPATPPDFTGLRGVSLASQFFLTNQAVADASQKVEEGYAELAVPLLKDIPLIQALGLNAAVRLTHYSTTGSATTWKIGGTWQVNDDLTMRVTRSRDIRAPTLYDLFAGTQRAPTFVLDPHTGVNAGFSGISGGNPSLRPEVGNTITGGFVYQASWLKGLSLSADYYNVRMANAITSLTTLALIQDCEASGGTAPSCANITRPLPFSDRSAANAPTAVRSGNVNVSKVETSGIDLDVSFRTELAGGVLTSRAYANYVFNFRTQLTAQQPLIDYAGYNAAGAGGVSGGVPRFKGNFSLDYKIGNLSIFAQENIIGSMKLGPPKLLVYVSPHIPAFYTTDMTLTYQLPPAWGGKMELFATATNLFDATPPLVYQTSVPHASGLSTIISLYDTTGRAFVAGLRFKF